MPDKIIIIRKVLLSRFYTNGHTLGFYSQISKSELKHRTRVFTVGARVLLHQYQT